jgi:hypothetical protein
MSIGTAFLLLISIIHTIDTSVIVKLVRFLNKYVALSFQGKVYLFCSSTLMCNPSHFFLSLIQKYQGYHGNDNSEANKVCAGCYELIVEA